MEDYKRKIDRPDNVLKIPDRRPSLRELVLNFVLQTEEELMIESTNVRDQVGRDVETRDCHPRLL